MNKKTLRDVNLQNQRVFLRADFNVPLDEQQRVSDDTRIRATLPTLHYAIEHGARVILASHLGRPKGSVNPKYSLKPVAARLTELLEKEVFFADDCVGGAVKAQIGQLKPGDVLVLENLRFHPEEEKNDAEFSGKLAELCDVYVNDAFGAAHRAHASTVGIAAYMRTKVAGFLMEKELHYLGQLITGPVRPYIAILGGAKVSDKIEVIKNLLTKVDGLLIGGGMAYTFLKSRGLSVGKSLVEDDKLALAADLMREANAKRVDFCLPVDHVVAETIHAQASTQVLPIENAPADRMGLDIGPKTISLFQEKIATAKTIFWNGPMGVFETAPFASGTMEIARAVANSPAISVIGGGDSVAAVHQAGVADKMTHISTGGGASLEFLSGLKLPGVEVLEDR